MWGVSGEESGFRGCVLLVVLIVMMKILVNEVDRGVSEVN